MLPPLATAADTTKEAIDSTRTFINTFTQVGQSAAS
jgi:hypothetical protein